jgi:SPP1 gp7 family putative phage head morphogenesis protein
MTKKSSEPRYIKTKTQSYASNITKEMRRLKKIIDELIIANLEEIRGNTRLDATKSLLDRLQDAFAFAMGTFFGQRLKAGEQPNMIRYSGFVERNIVNLMIRGVQAAQWSKFKRSHKKIQGVDPIKNVPGLSDYIDTATASNVEMITSLGQGYFDDVYRIVSDGFQGGDLNSTIATKIKAEFGVSKQRAQLIARDQVSSINGQLERQLATGNGVTKYIWHTNIDGRERDRHEELNGTEQDWNKPPVTVTTGKRAGERNHPGEDIQCRCYAENVYED